MLLAKIKNKIWIKKEVGGMKWRKAGFSGKKKLVDLKGPSEIHTHGVKWDNTPGRKLGKDLGNTSCINCTK